MKKQIISIIIIAVLPLVANADAVEIDGIYYNLLKKLKTAEVTSKPSGYYNGDVTIPKTVTYNDITYNVTSIGDYAFQNCTGLVKISIPNSVTSLGGHAFYGCSGLTSVTIPDSVISIGAYVFTICNSLESLTIGNSVKSIPNTAFGGCTKLKSVTIPNSVTSIGERAFIGCSNLTNVTIGNSVTEIGKYAFYNCSNLKSIYITDIEAWLNIEKNSYSIEPSYHLYLNNEEIIDLSFPSTITSISSFAFVNCIGITSVNIPNTITSIGAGAFSGCTNLKNISIPNSVNSIWNLVFENCTNLTSVTIPNSVTSMGGYVFKGCTGLTSVNIPNSITSISSGLFEGCKNLESVNIPFGVIEVGGGVFKDCISLIEILIPNSVTKIGDSYSASRGTFAGCSNLTSLTIPDGVTFMGNYIFDDCNKLTDIYCYAEKAPSTGRNIFSKYHVENATLHVPATAIDNYKMNEPWSGFKSIVAIEGDTPERPKCVKPIITYTDGKLKFTCETEGVTYVTDITDADIKRHFDATIMLTATYNISVYATKTGYEDSDIATATLCWIDSTPTMEGITNEVANVRATPVLIQNNGNVVSISGTLEGTGISIYDLSGKMVGSAEATSDVTNVYTSLRSGEVGIVKIGDKAIKVMMK